MLRGGAECASRVPLHGRRPVRWPRRSRRWHASPSRCPRRRSAQAGSETRKGARHRVAPRVRKRVTARHAPSLRRSRTSKLLLKRFTNLQPPTSKLLLKRFTSLTVKKNLLFFFDVVRPDRGAALPVQHRVAGGGGGELDGQRPRAASITAYGRHPPSSPPSGPPSGPPSARRISPPWDTLPTTARTPRAPSHPATTASARTSSSQVGDSRIIETTKRAASASATNVSAQGCHQEPGAYLKRRLRAIYK